MKVLFAIRDDDNIINSLARKYKADFGKELLYKEANNFTAIVREIQENNDYNRIIVSDDFDKKVNQSDEKEAILFKKLKGLLSVAKGKNGKDIPIIFLANNRKIAKVAVDNKVYNFLVGKDITKKNIYELIKKSRNKSQVKEYNELIFGSSSLSKSAGEAKKKDNAVEMKMVNASKKEAVPDVEKYIKYFKRENIQDNRCIDRFEKACNQLSRSDLLILVESLNAKVRRVLRENSKRFKKIEDRINEKNTIDKEIDKASERNKVQEAEKKSQNNIKENKQENKKEEKSEEPEVKKRGRGRPRKVVNAEEPVVQKVKRGRGRPRKNPIEEVDSTDKKSKEPPVDKNGEKEVSKKSEKTVAKKVKVEESNKEEPKKAVKATDLKKGNKVDEKKKKEPTKVVQAKEEDFDDWDLEDDYDEIVAEATNIDIADDDFDLNFEDDNKQDSVEYDPLDFDLDEEESEEDDFDDLEDEEEPEEDDFDYLEDEEEPEEDDFDDLEDEEEPEEDDFDDLEDEEEPEEDDFGDLEDEEELEEDDFDDLEDEEEPEEDDFGDLEDEEEPEEDDFDDLEDEENLEEDDFDDLEDEEEPEDDDFGDLEDEEELEEDDFDDLEDEKKSEEDDESGNDEITIDVDDMDDFEDDDYKEEIDDSEADFMNIEDDDENLNFVEDDDIIDLDDDNDESEDDLLSIDDSDEDTDEDDNLLSMEDNDFEDSEDIMDLDNDEGNESEEITNITDSMEDSDDYGLLNFEDDSDDEEDVMDLDEDIGDESEDIMDLDDDIDDESEGIMNLDDDISDESEDIMDLDDDISDDFEGSDEDGLLSFEDDLDDESEGIMNLDDDISDESEDIMDLDDESNDDLLKYNNDRRINNIEDSLLDFEDESDDDGIINFGDDSDDDLLDLDLDDATTSGDNHEEDLNDDSDEIMDFDEEDDLFSIDNDDDDEKKPSLGADNNIKVNDNNSFSGIKNKNYVTNNDISKQISAINGDGESDEDLSTPEAVNTIKISNNQNVVAFVGSHNSGNSFLVNNLGQLLSEQGVKTAIVDLTKNKNSYYIYTENEENMRNIAYSSFEKLKSGIADGIKVNKNLTIYTALPNSDSEIEDREIAMSTLLNNYSLILFDCDFNTDLEYFNIAQDIFFVQTFDILTIQGLTSFIKKLKMNKVEYENKMRIVINKYVNLSSINERAIIAAVSVYNSPDTTYQLDLFDRNNVEYVAVPFEERNYCKYLDDVVKCKLTIRGYTKNMINSLNKLAKLVYPINGKKNKSK